MARKRNETKEDARKSAELAVGKTCCSERWLMLGVRVQEGFPESKLGLEAVTCNFPPEAFLDAVGLIVESLRQEMVECRKKDDTPQPLPMADFMKNRAGVIDVAKNGGAKRPFNSIKSDDYQPDEKPDEKPDEEPKIIDERLQDVQDIQDIIDQAKNEEEPND